MTEETKISAADKYRAVRAQIEHEDNLVSQRLSWLLASQSFLFTAYAITLNGPAQSHFKSYEASAALLIGMITLVGLVSALLIWFSILAGFLAMKKLREHFKEHVGAAPEGFPTIQTSGIPFRAGQIGPVLIPLLFMGVWLALLIRG